MEDNRNIERHAANTILESGVRVPLPAPLFLRLFGKKEIGITIRAPYRGQLKYISQKVLQPGFDSKKLESGDLKAVHELIVDHSDTVNEIIAIAILRRKRLIKWFTKRLAKWLDWKLDNKRTSEIMFLIVVLSNVQDFTNTIRLAEALNLMKPKNLSQKTKGSIEDEQPDSIAPGEQSGA